MEDIPPCGIRPLADKMTVRLSAERESFGHKRALKHREIWHLYTCWDRCHFVKNLSKGNRKNEKTIVRFGLYFWKEQLNISSI